MRKFHFQMRKSPANSSGQHLLAFRFGIGYWPCLKAPFIQLCIGKWIVEAWHGLPSYYGDKRNAESTNGVQDRLA